MSILHSALLLAMLSAGDEKQDFCSQVKAIQKQLASQALKLYEKQRPGPRRRARALLAEARELETWAPHCFAAGQERREGGKEGPKGEGEQPHGDASGAAGKVAPVVQKSVWPCLTDPASCESDGAELVRAEVLRSTVTKAARKTLWGADGRRTPTAPIEQAVAQATAALIAPNDMVRRNDRWRVGPVKLLREGWSDLCPDEKFQDEPLVAGCSGVLVSPQWVATARHCVVSVASPRIVFGFGFPSPTPLKTESGKRYVEFPAANVFEVVEILRSESWEDWALLRLDRPAGVTPVALDLGWVDDREAAELAIVGYPRGLPLKYAAQAWVLPVGAAEDPGVFHASLDAYSGNSGSPIVRHGSGQLVGLLSAGAADVVFDQERGCRRSLVCQKDAYCPGEQVQRIDGSFARAWKAVTGGPPPSTMIKQKP